MRSWFLGVRSLVRNFRMMGIDFTGRKFQANNPKTSNRQKGRLMYCSSRTRSLELSQGSCAYASHKPQRWNSGVFIMTITPSRLLACQIPMSLNPKPIPSYPNLKPTTSIPTISLSLKSTIAKHYYSCTKRLGKKSEA